MISIQIVRYVVDANVRFGFEFEIFPFSFSKTTFKRIGLNLLLLLLSVLFVIG